MVKIKRYYESHHPIYISSDKNGIWDLSNINIKKIKFSVPYESIYSRILC